MAINNLNNLQANKKSNTSVLPGQQDFYLSAPEYNQLLQALKDLIADYNSRVIDGDWQGGSGTGSGGSDPEAALKYLRKDINDQASGLIEFLAGIIVGGTATFNGLLKAGRIEAKDIDVENRLQAKSLQIFTQAYLREVILKAEPQHEG